MNFQDQIFINSLVKIKSPTFLDKLSDETLLIYNKKNDLNLNDDTSLEDLSEALSLDMNRDPDGYLIFIENNNKEQIKELIKNRFLDAFKNDELNLTNGDWCETILFYNVEDGLVVEFVDPECFSDFFKNLVNEIKNCLEEKSLLFFELNHMSSHIKELSNTNLGAKFLNILDKNHINY